MTDDIIELAAQDGTDTPDTGSGESWQPVDLATVSTDPITPEFLFRSDRHALIYPGRISWISAEPEAGKTWIALVAVKQAIESGRRVLVLDYEDSPAGFLERCEALSIKAVQAQADRLLRYIAPSEPLSSGNRATLGAVAFADTIEWKPELVILDACTASMANEGLDPNGNSDIAAWLNIAVKPLTRAGAAVLVIDHVTKSREGRERWAIGGQHKLAAVDGAAFSVEAIQPFGRAHKDPVHGLSRLTLQKDRPGYLRGLTNGTKAAPIADLAVTAWPDGGVTAHLEVPGQGGIDEHQQRVVERLSVYDGETKTALRSLGNSDSMDAAITALVSAGHVRIERKGASHLHFLTTPGRDFWAELLDEDCEAAA